MYRGLKVRPYPCLVEVERLFPKDKSWQVTDKLTSTRKQQKLALKREQEIHLFSYQVVHALLATVGRVVTFPTAIVFPADSGSHCDPMLQGSV